MEKDTVDSTPAIVGIDLDSTDFVGPIESHSILDSSNVSTTVQILIFLIFWVNVINLIISYRGLMKLTMS